MKADPSPFRMTVADAGGYTKKAWIIGENEFCPSYGLLLICHSEKQSAEESALISLMIGPRACQNLLNAYYLFLDVLWFSFRMISSSFLRSGSRMFSFGCASSERPPAASFSNLPLDLVCRSVPGVKLFVISFQYSQITKASAHTISGASTNRRMVFSRLLCFLFLFATFKSIN